MKQKIPLNAEALRQLALTYVGRYATSQARLEAYLARKLREHGWDGEGTGGGAIAQIAQTMVRLRFVDDRAYAEMKSDSLVRRGYGPRRVRHALGAAGIGEEDAQSALEAASESAEQAALAFARRRRLGPFARQPEDLRQRERALAAMIRAGHDYATARRILDLPPETVQKESDWSGG